MLLIATRYRQKPSDVDSPIANHMNLYPCMLKNFGPNILEPGRYNILCKLLTTKTTIDEEGSKRVVGIWTEGKGIIQVNQRK